MPIVQPVDGGIGADVATFDTTAAPDAFDSEMVPDESLPDAALDMNDVIEDADTAVVDSAVDEGVLIDMGVDAAFDAADAMPDAADADVDARDEGGGPLACTGAIAFTTAGTRTVPGAGDFVPLCGTRVAIADRSTHRVVIRDLVSGATDASYPVGAPPASLAFDDTRRLLYVNLAPYPRLVRVNLVTGATFPIPIAAPVSSITTTADGKVLGWMNASKTALVVVDGVGGKQWAVSSPLPYFGGHIAHSAKTGMLYLGEGGYSNSKLVRYRLDLMAPALVYQESFPTGPVYEMALSTDGARISTGVLGSMIDRDALSFTSVAGEWITGYRAEGPAFSADSALFGATERETLMLFDAKTHVRLTSASVMKCSTQYRHSLFARTGRVYLALAECSTSDGSAAIGWLPAP